MIILAGVNNVKARSKPKEGRAKNKGVKSMEAIDQFYGMGSYVEFNKSPMVQDEMKWKFLKL